GLGAHRTRIDLPGIAEPGASAQRHRGIAVTVEVGIRRVHAATGEHRRGAAAACVDAVGLLVAGIDAEPCRSVASVETGAGRAQAIAARADPRAHARAFVAVAGE